MAKRSCRRLHPHRWRRRRCSSGRLSCPRSPRGWRRWPIRDAAGFVLVSGEAGVGKTALVRRFCDELRRRRELLWGSCDALFTPRPLGPLFDIAEITGGELERAGRGGRQVLRGRGRARRRAEQPGADGRRPRGRPPGRRRHARRAPAARGADRLGSRARAGELSGHRARPQPSSSASSSERSSRRPGPPAHGRARSRVPV